MINHLILHFNKGLIHFLFAPILINISIDTYAQSEQNIVLVADEMYKFGDKLDAMDVYMQALEMNNNNAYVNFMIGKCYVETIHKAKSLPYFLKALKLDGTVTPNVLYLVGLSYHLNYNFDSAVVYYNKYKSQIQMEDSRGDISVELKKIERRIYECSNARQYLKNPTDVKIENIGNVINTKHADYAPVVSADQSEMFFTSRRPGSTGDNKDVDNEYYEDIYVSYKNGTSWTVPANVGNHINTKFHDASIGLSADGNQLFIYRDDEKNTGDIFYCKKTSSGEWSKPKSLDGINTEAIENSISISKDEKTLYFSSNKPGGLGGMDLYMSKIDKKGKWGKPENLGSEINTEYDDEGPFVSLDGKILYFCSRGHDGMGGMDLYKSEYSNGKWMKPENLKYPINSVDDDLYFVTSGDGEYGYYASIKEDVIGNADIYRISLSEKKVDSIKKELSKETVEKRKIKVLVTINDKDTHLPLNSLVEVRNLGNNKLMTNGNADKGIFQFELDDNNLNDMTITATKQGYIFKTKSLTVSNNNNTSEYNIHLELTKIKDGKSIILRNIYFAFDKSTIKKESTPELERLLNFLTQNAHVTIEIGGHTDFKGSDLYNLNLSQKRTEEVVSWLIAKGISRSRLKAKGYGETKPLASNDDEEEGRELNRRTEFTILNDRANVITQRK